MVQNFAACERYVLIGFGFDVDGLQRMGAFWQCTVVGLEADFVGGVCVVGVQSDENHSRAASMVVVGTGNGLRNSDGSSGLVQAFIGVNYVRLHNLEPIGYVA